MLGGTQVGGKKRRTARDVAQKLVDNGQDVYILSWKKQNPFGEQMFCFDHVEMISRFDQSQGAMIMDKQITKGLITRFIPEDEDNIPIAYVPATEHNKLTLARCLANAPYVIRALATFGGVRQSQDAVQELIQIAKANPPKPRKKWVGRDVNGQLINGDQIKPLAETKGAAIEVPKQAPIAQVEPAFTSADEAYTKAESQVMEKYSLFLKPMKDKHGDNFRNSKDFKNTFGVEIETLYEQYLGQSGLVDNRSKPEPEKKTLTVIKAEKTETPQV